MLVAYCWLCHHGGNLAEGGCLLSRFHFTRCCYFLVHVACLNFKTSHVSVYKCLSLIVGFAITVAIWLREVVSCHDFILRAVATFWAMSLVGIYPGRASFNTEPITHQIGCGLKVFAKFLLPKIATVSIFP